MSARRRAKLDRRARRKSRSGAGPSGVVAFERLIAALEERGQTVHRVGPGLAFTLCPSCLAKGRRSLLEIRAVPAGVRLHDCEGGDGS